MATATISKRSLDRAQRDWLKKMGVALETPVAVAPHTPASPVQPVIGVTSVTFTVTDKKSGDPIVGADISMEDLRRQTDGNGAVQFQIDPGTYGFRITSESHQNASGLVKAAAGTNTEQLVKLEREAEWIPPPESDQPTLRKGDDSDDGWVEYLQSLLNHQFGKDVVSHNGKFDSETEKWVIAFQKREKLAVDGIVGNQTWAALRERSRENQRRMAHSAHLRGNRCRRAVDDRGRRVCPVR